MLSYALLDSVFIIFIGLVVTIAWRPLPKRRLAIVAFVLCALTAIFDNLAIHFDFFLYNPEHILGIFLGRVPLEDFAYPLVAALLIPYLWKRQK
jgi:lycopene cyclase domain-containing protein